MEEKIKISYVDHIHQTILKNLLRAHDISVESRNVKEIILLTKFILKFSKQFNNKVFNLGLKESEKYTGSPPSEREHNITDFK